MNAPRIAVCMVNNSSSEEKVKDLIRSHGFEVMDEKHRQIDATRKTLGEIEADPDALMRYFGRQLSAADADDPTHVYLDFEHHKHLAIKEKEPEEYALFSAELTKLIRARMPMGCRVGIWNPFVMLQGILATTESSLDTLEQRQRLNPQDFLIVNGNTREHVNSTNRFRWTHRLVTGIAVARDHAARHGDMPVYLSWQTRSRPRTGAVRHRPADVSAWWATAMHQKVDTLWWLNAGENNEQLEARLAEFENMVPLMKHGIDAGSAI